MISRMKELESGFLTPGFLAIRYWVDMQTARFNHIKANVGNPLLSASGGAYGVDFVFWAISMNPTQQASSFFSRC